MPLMDIALLQVMNEYNDGNLKPLADYIRKFGVSKDQREIVAAMIDGTFKRRNRALLAGDRKLDTLRSYTAFYKREKRWALQDPGYIPSLVNMEAVYSAVAKHHNMEVAALKKLKQPKRQRTAGRMAKAGK